ncbi:hypothetical protein BCV70DRAFT_199960 [Testicularia cyperi]|uniref:Mediator of RNA polymerase II transcription subunit 21 n=1 Tax=Testicularia cyperi TaxID=1882483 RepID=A0A317XRH4_9BASI|nr:hypothetical protein BCV70DRAFT_199960 [Testicularia cyperi]
MDLLTQLDGDIDLLLKIMSSSVAYVSRKAKHEVLPGTTLPLTVLGQTESIPPNEMRESIAELVADLVAKAQEIHTVIQHLPDQSIGDESQLRVDLGSLESQLRLANDEYRAAVQEAKDLHSRVALLQEAVAREFQNSRAWLATRIDPETAPHRRQQTPLPSTLPPAALPSSTHT